MTEPRPAIDAADRAVWCRPASSVVRPGSRPPATFDQEITCAVRAERRLAVKALIALAIVGLVVGARLLFFG